MDRLTGWVVMALLVAVALPSIAAVAHSLIPVLVMAMLALIALRLLA